MLPAARRTSRRPVPNQGHGAFKKIVALGLVIIVIVVVGLGVHHADEHIIAKNRKTNTQTSSSVRTPQPQNDAVLNQIINGWQQNYSFTASVVVKELTGDLRAANYSQATSVVPASTYKIYVAYAILHGIEQGSYSLSTVTSDGATIQTDLDTMIINSDNDAARTLGFLYGWKNINTLLQAHGATATNLFNYIPPNTDPIGDKHTTAADLATIVEKLYAGQLLNQTNTQLLLGLMEKQNYRERIPSGVPVGITVADKPGWLTGNDDGTVHVENDAAIVYGPKSTYVLVVTTNNNSDTSPLAALSKLVYAHLEE